MNFPTTLSKVLSSLLLKGTKERKFRLGKISQDVTSNDTILHVEKKIRKPAEIRSQLSKNLCTRHYNMPCANNELFLKWNTIYTVHNK